MTSDTLTRPALARLTTKLNEVYEERDRKQENGNDNNDHA